jgi:hypothetical protein
MVWRIKRIAKNVGRRKCVRKETQIAESCSIQLPKFSFKLEALPRMPGSSGRQLTDYKSEWPKGTLPRNQLCACARTWEQTKPLLGEQTTLSEKNKNTVFLVFYFSVSAAS